MVRSIPCTVVLHDDSVSLEDVLCGTDVLPEGYTGYLTAPGAWRLCVAARNAAPNADEISIHVAVARRFGFENRMKASVDLIEGSEDATATHVELLFRDQNLSRADMWRLKAYTEGTVFYQGKRVVYLGSATADVEAIYIDGEPVESALISNPRTKLIFRSANAHYTILIQVSQELLELWADGKLLHERLTAGFLPALFQRWDIAKVRHQVTIVLYGRRLKANRNRMAHGKISGEHDLPHQEVDDFYSIIASDVASGDWQGILRSVKRAMHDRRLCRDVTLAADGNMLEAIHVAAMHFVNDTDDLRLASSGNSVIAITAGAGLFDADYALLKRTTELLMGNSIGVDIVSLSPRPLHPVPLFQYERDKQKEYALPHWVDISYWTTDSDDHRSTWLWTDAAEDLCNIAVPRLTLPLRDATTLLAADAMHSLDDSLFTGVSGAEAVLDPEPETHNVNPRADANGVVKAVPTVRGQDNASLSTGANHEDQPSSISLLASTPGIKPADRKGLPPHPLMQSRRNISLGPRGLALSQGLASTTISAQHAQHDRASQDTSTGTADQSSSGLVRQIRDSLKRKPSMHSLSSRATEDVAHPSRPINIQTGEEDTDVDLEDPATLMEIAVMDRDGPATQESGEHLFGTPATERRRMLIVGSLANDGVGASGSPWLTLLNPCNPRRENMHVASEYRKWQNVFPRAIGAGAFKWDSMTTPASLPLMTEDRVSLTDLERRYNKKVRRLVTTPSQASSIKPCHQVMAQLIAMRLGAGFQIAPTRGLHHSQMPSEHIDRMLLSLGKEYHELSVLSDFEVQISEFTHPEHDPGPDAADGPLEQYRADLRPIGSHKGLMTEIPLRRGHTVTDWSSLDDQSVHSTALTDGLGKYRVRFVLIPVEPLRTEAHGLPRSRDLSDDERHIEGIQRLTQMWQRHRYFGDGNHRSQTPLVRPKAGAAEKDPNPLAIEYQTRDPSSAVISLAVTSHSALGTRPLNDSETYNSGDFDIPKVVRHMQEPPPNGIEVRDRRWLTRMHLKCFRGDEMTNWLLRVFKDLQTRGDAVALGNHLMKQAVFAHVRGRHEFRDGNYFYQIKSAHRTTDYPDTAGLFGKAIGRSVPSTPGVELKQSPAVRPIHVDSGSSSKATSTPILSPADKYRRHVMLSEVLQYNVDPTRKSNQLEIVNLHYDGVHNPDNCYHIHLDWTKTTAKLIRESVTRWSGLIEGHGLRLVQLPLMEACKIHEHHPFEHTIRVNLALRPPERLPATPHLDAQAQHISLGLMDDPEGYHKAVLRKLGFVLDLEAASAFPRKVDVSYSWGRPDYHLTQFVHNTGQTLAQISKDGQSDFLLLPNCLDPSVNPGTARKTASTTFEDTLRAVKAFCKNEQALRAFYEEVKKPKVTTFSPFANSTVSADSDVPPIELPPHLTR